MNMKSGLVLEEVMKKVWFGLTEVRLAGLVQELTDHQNCSELSQHTIGKISVQERG